MLSATAGLNEPPVVAALSSGEDLGAQAGAVAQARRPDAAPVLPAPGSAPGEVTDGRIVGIASTTVDGVPALLVYLRKDGATQVVVVTGCGGEAPSAGPSAPVSALGTTQAAFTAVAAEVSGYRAFIAERRVTPRRPRRPRT